MCLKIYNKHGYQEAKDATLFLAHINPPYHIYPLPNEELLVNVQIPPAIEGPPSSLGRCNLYQPKQSGREGGSSGTDGANL